MYQFETESSSINKILNAAMTLYWRYGIRRVTVQEICEKAGISKMTFYRKFNNKHEVAKEVLQQSIDQSVSSYRSIMSSSKSFRSKIEQLIHEKQIETQGISEELLKDIYANDMPELTALINTHQALMLSEIKKDFEQAQKNGDLRGDLSIDFILYKMNRIQTELFDEQLSKIYPNKDELIMALTNFFFYGIIDCKE